MSAQSLTAAAIAALVDAELNRRATERTHTAERNRNLIMRDVRERLSPEVFAIYHEPHWAEEYPGDDHTAIVLRGHFTINANTIYTTLLATLNNDNTGNYIALYVTFADTPEGAEYHDEQNHRTRIYKTADYIAALADYLEEVERFNTRLQLVA